jgi:primosomal protein N' (replication factor Y)
MAEAIGFLEMAHALDQAEGVFLYDPVPALMPRIANRERAQLLVQSSNRGRLQAFLTRWITALRAQKTGTVRWSLDVDPLDW